MLEKTMTATISHRCFSGLTVIRSRERQQARRVSCRDCRATSGSDRQAYTSILPCRTWTS